MGRSTRLFELIQILRAADRPVSAARLAETLEVSVRTIYRDIAALQGMRTPVEGAAGVGYILRSSYDLPPVNFDAEEVEALRVGLLMLARTGDSALQRAALRVRQKITDLNDPVDWLQVAPWGIALDDPAQGCVSFATLRTAIREESKLRLTYRDAQQVETVRVVWPIVIVYHIECVLLVGWCDLRVAFRHFRTDRIYGCQLLERHSLDKANPYGCFGPSKIAGMKFRSPIFQYGLWHQGAFLQRRGWIS